MCESKHSSDERLVNTFQCSYAFMSQRYLSSSFPMPLSEVPQFKMVHNEFRFFSALVNNIGPLLTHFHRGVPVQLLLIKRRRMSLLRSSTASILPYAVYQLSLTRLPAPQLQQQHDDGGKGTKNEGRSAQTERT